MKASLAKSKIENGVIICPWHHWKYDLKTGQCLNIEKVKLKTYEIEINDNFIYVLIN